MHTAPYARATSWLSSYRYGNPNPAAPRLLGQVVDVVVRIAGDVVGREADGRQPGARVVGGDTSQFQLDVADVRAVVADEGDQQRRPTGELGHRDLIT